MKAKKALKKLVKAEELLSIVNDRYAANDHVVHQFLDAAIGSVTSAKETLDSGAANGSAKKPPIKAAKTANARKATAASKRKANGAEAARPMSKTA